MIILAVFLEFCGMSNLRKFCGDNIGWTDFWVSRLLWVHRAESYRQPLKYSWDASNEHHHWAMIRWESVPERSMDMAYIINYSSSSLLWRYSKQKYEGRLFFLGLCRKTSFEKFIPIPIFSHAHFITRLRRNCLSEAQLLAPSTRPYNFQICSQKTGTHMTQFQSFSIFPPLE